MHLQSLMNVNNVSNLSEAADKRLKSKTSDFFRKLYSEDCPEEDCEELTSPCCSKKLNTVFGTIPVQVRCELCKNTFLLKEILKQEGIIKI